MVKKYTNTTVKMVFYLGKRPEVLCVEMSTKGFQLWSYFEVVERGLSEIRWKIVTPQVDGCGS